MKLNLKDPDSIVEWWRCHPERHWLYLEVLEVSSPQCRGAIQHTSRRIQSDPMFSRSQVDAVASAACRAESRDPEVDALSSVEAVAPLH